MPISDWYHSFGYRRVFHRTFHENLWAHKMNKHIENIDLYSNRSINAPSISKYHRTTGVRKKTLGNFSIRLAKSRIFKPLREISNGDVFVFGGAIRRAVNSSQALGDLDVLIHNSNTSAVRALLNSDSRHSYNRQGHHRFKTFNEQIDIFRPEEFYSGFHSVESAVKFFDFRISALAVCIDTGRLIDPYDVLDRYPFRNPEINWARWEKMPATELCVLAIRLVKIMREIPEMRIPKNDVDRLIDEVRPIIRSPSQRPFWGKYPFGADIFFTEFDRTINFRSAQSPKSLVTEHH